MTTHMKIKNTLALLLPFLFCAYSHAAVVVTIDLTNPSAAVISSVANNSLLTVKARVHFNGGISFRNFFTADESIPITSPLAISGNWMARFANPYSYNQMITFNEVGYVRGPGRDLEIYNGLAPDHFNQYFNTNAAPFTGSSTVDLFSFLPNLPALGATGDINVGRGFNSGFEYLDEEQYNGVLIGSWQIVPEPSAISLLAVGLGIVLRRRRRTV